jgi:thiamine biosynthesis protein ThiI
MMRVAHVLAGTLGAKCLVTGDSLGQVASQTVENLGVIQAVTGLPVLRPLLCMDKHEIILGARKLGTYKNSILAFPDACSLFVPKNPETKARLEVIEHIEEYLDWESHVEACAESIERVS